MTVAQRGTGAIVVGAAATLAFVVLRAVVALGGHEPLAVDIWWHDLMVALSSDCLLYTSPSPRDS